MKEFCFSNSQIEAALERMAEYCRVSGNESMVVHKLDHQWKSVGDLEGINGFTLV